MRRSKDGFGAGLAFACICLLGLVPPAAAQDAAAPQEPKEAQVLTQGPIHEAFAEPLVFDPKPGPIAPKSPPVAINELPPDQKPEGDHVQWIPGYWAWDDSRSDYIWVSGVWRAIPPGRDWVPGYWHQVEGGYQWVPGYWSTTDATQTQYLPAPPANLDAGPNSEAPAGDATWSPGSWVWQDNQYAWQPGFWVNNQPGWMWNPSSYNWTPNGYVYNRGYWDYPLTNRGLAFAPTYFSSPIYSQPNFMYTPTSALVATSALLSNLFVRPSYGSYYFGDYYAPNNFQSGIYPWNSFHGSRYGYDPLYAYSAAQNYRNPRWAEDQRGIFQYRRDHPEARPARTWDETRRIVARPATGANVSPANSNLTMARPLSQFAAPRTGGAGNTKTEGNALRFEQLNDARRQAMARQSTQSRQFSEDRQKREVDASKAVPAADRNRPRALDAPRSPITAAPEAHRTPPPSPPRLPAVDNTARPAARSAPPIRPEPHPDARPPAPRPAPAPAPAPGAAPGGPAPKKK